MSEKQFCVYMMASDKRGTIYIGVTSDLVGRVWMRWIKPWEGYGFPLPKGARDLLIGHDRQFYGD